MSEPHGLKAAVSLRRVWPGVCAPARLAGARCRCALTQEAGTATVEFCMVFPIVLFLILILVQATLLMVGNQFVHYAAFAATRSAIVYIPADMTDEGGVGRNSLSLTKGSPKYDAIRASAYFAVMPVCGKLDDSNEPLRTDEFVDGLKSHFTSYGQDAPRWVDTLAADRLRYAAENTDIQIMRTVVTNQDVEFEEILVGDDPFGPREAITVWIEHKLNLSVPYVRGIFADDDHPDGRGKYALVTAHYTLTNEGINPDLPDKPDIDRKTE